MKESRIKIKIKIKIKEKDVKQSETLQNDATAVIGLRQKTKRAVYHFIMDSQNIVTIFMYKVL